MFLGIVQHYNTSALEVFKKPGYAEITVKAESIKKLYIQRMLVILILSCIFNRNGRKEPVNTACE